MSNFLFVTLLCIVTCTIAVAIVFGFLGEKLNLSAMVIERSLVAECIEWKEQAEKYAGFFLTEWQQDQCDDMGVKIAVQSVPSLDIPGFGEIETVDN